MYLSYTVEMSVNNLFENKLLPKKLIATIFGKNLKPKIVIIYKNYKSMKKSGRNCSGNMEI